MFAEELEGFLDLIIAFNMGVELFLSFHILLTFAF